jgi:hypothetical protein
MARKIKTIDGFFMDYNFISHRNGRLIGPTWGSYRPDPVGQIKYPPLHEPPRVLRRFFLIGFHSAFENGEGQNSFTFPQPLLSPIASCSSNSDAHQMTWIDHFCNCCVIELYPCIPPNATGRSPSTIPKAKKQQTSSNLERAESSNLERAESSNLERAESSNLEPRLPRAFPQLFPALRARYMPRGGNVRERRP